jgi:hypothetical protein
MEKKIFVLVDKNLSRSQQAVQSGHSLINFVSSFPNEDWTKTSLVLLAVNGEDELWEWLQILNTDQKTFFREPYWQDRLTAVAAHGVHIEEQVKDLLLL